MSSRALARFVSRRFSTSGKVLSEEEKAVENVYIKGPDPDEKPPTSTWESGSVIDAKATSQTSNSGVSTDKNPNYAVLAGIVTLLGALGWYLKSNKKQKEVQD